MNLSRLRLIVGYTVTAAWAVSFVFDALLREYEAQPWVHAAMMLVAGSLFAPAFSGKNGDK